MHILDLVNFWIALAELNHHLISEAFADISSRMNCLFLFCLVCRPIIILFTVTFGMYTFFCLDIKLLEDKLCDLYTLFPQKLATCLLYNKCINVY